MSAKEEIKSGDLLLEHDILEMFKMNLYTDVRIQVKSKITTKYFDAHKLILATRSSVFANYFCSQTEQSSLTAVTVKNVSIRGFDILLWYIYSNQMKTDCAQELIEVSKTARRMGIGGVSSACKYQLAKCPVSIDNLCLAFEASRYFKMESINSKCTKMIQAAPERDLFDSSGFQNASRETVSAILAIKNLSTPITIAGTIRWLQQHKVRDRSLLSRYRLTSFSCDEFLDLVEKFPLYFTSREIASILSNSLRPGIMELPPWCEAEVNHAKYDNVGLSSDLYDEIVTNALQVKTDCNKRFPKSYLHGRDGFEGEVIFELKLSNSFPDESHLVMLELAFGSSFAPVKNLELELFYYEQCSALKRRIPFSLKTSREHHYLILKKKIRVQPNYPLVFNLNLRTFGLKKWEEDSPISDSKYRAAQIPGDIFYNMGLKAFGCESVSLTLLSDWLIFLDPILGEKSLLLTSFYFDSSSNI